MLYVLKIGGVVLTDKNGYAAARLDVIERIAKEIADAKKRHGFDLVLVNGAGSFGHAPVKKYGIREGLRTPEHAHGFTMVHKHVEDLNRRLWDFLQGYGLTSVPVHPCSFVLAKDGKFEVNTPIIKEMLKHGMVPLLYGDVVMDTVRGCSIVSGDDLAPMLGASLKAQRVLMGSDVNGVYDKDPKSDKSAKSIPDITDSNWKEVLGLVGGSAATDVTGGMREKLRKLAVFAGGTECLIFDAQIPGNTERVLSGELIGTRIRVTQT